MPSFRSHYDVLGIDRGATEGQIKAAYRKLALKYHPDKSKDPASVEMFQATQAAYECLVDPTTREEYDRSNDRPQRYNAQQSHGYASSYASPTPPMPRSSYGTAHRAHSSPWTAGGRSRPAASFQTSYEFFPDTADESYTSSHGQYSRRGFYHDRGRMDADYEIRYPPSSRRDHEHYSWSPRRSPSERRSQNRGRSCSNDDHHTKGSFDSREEGYYPRRTDSRPHPQLYDDFEEDSRQLRDDGRRMRGHSYHHHDDFDTWNASAPRGSGYGPFHHRPSRQRQHFQRMHGYQTVIDRGYGTQLREAHIRMTSDRMEYEVPYRHGYGNYGRPLYPRFTRQWR